MNVMPRRRAIYLSLAAVLLAHSSGSARQAAPTQATPPAPRPAAPPDTRWADWVEPDFPFFSSVLDAHRDGQGLPAVNLTPRALILNVGKDLWVGFDTDLLRVAAVWQGKGVSPRALAPGSYRQPDKKTPGGQFPAPEPEGKIWMATGVYPGWQTGSRPSQDDPRDPAPTRQEVGRGPLTEEQGRFKAIRLVRGGAVLEYTAGSADVREWMTASEHAGHLVLERHFDLAPSKQPLWLVLGVNAPPAGISIAGGGGATLEKVETDWTVRVPAHDQRVGLCVAVAGTGAVPAVQPRPMPADLPAPRWPQEVSTTVTLSTAKDAYVVDDVALPIENPWRRNVRMGDIQFLKDGTGVGVTLDGDVWLIRGMHDAKGVARWRRFASGLHEPLTLAIRDEQIYVFDRNGIWRLRDTNGDGEADVHELFSNAFAQTADMREFPATIRLAPEGAFVIAKGGQEATTIGKHNGSVLRVSADGRRAEVLGYGFRQPNIAVNVRTGLVTASDQQGNYIPSTPLHIVRGRQFYGFLSDKLPREVYPAPIAEALTWIPHTANASALSQVWLFGARMGPLNDSLVHIGFNNPELFRVLFNNRGTRPQAAVVSVTGAFDYPTLNGSVNPADGQLYIAGFQIFGWGTTATRLAGLGRVRYTGGASTAPREVTPTDKGVLLRFDVPLDPRRALDANNYSVTSWHYQRTYKYGSPHLKADGSPGMDRLAPSHAYLSKDGKGLFIAVPGMTPVMQMRVSWSLATADGAMFQESAYFTPYELTKFNPAAEGFGNIAIDLSPKAVAADASAPVSADEGRRLYQAYGCMACHAIDDSSLSRLGPTWKGLYGRERTFDNSAVRALADEAYLRESILEPAAKIVAGYERGESGMPSYAGVLTAAQIESIVQFIRSLK